MNTNENPEGTKGEIFLDNSAKLSCDEGSFLLELGERIQEGLTEIDRLRNRFERTGVHRGHLG